MSRFCIGECLSHARREHVYCRVGCEDVFCCVQAAPLKVAWTDCDGGRWCTLTSAILADQACSSSPQLAVAFSREGLPLVTGAPAWLLGTWLKNVPGIRSATPATARSHLRAKGAALALMQSPPGERAEAADAMLSYCLSDLELSSASALQQLVGLHIVQTLQGGLVALQTSQTGAQPLLLAIEEQQRLLPPSQSFHVLHCKVISIFLAALPLTARIRRILRAWHTGCHGN